jgi:murein DD-endopeptidase MepM/ murein hydrolase activator NlpD
VTAYAHAKKLLVKEGQAVAQGDVIAQVGDTGSVNSPQLFFQVRKGKTPLDPEVHLSGNGPI